jgi:hypothetical protein
MQITFLVMIGNYPDDPIAYCISVFLEALARCGDMI